MTTGYFHSFESCGAVDGPGLRFVAFLSGCPLRCLYCHNPDTWELKQDIALTPGQLLEKIRPYRNFLRNGGVTLSGGEPLMQADFCAEFLSLCKAEQLHTAIDTSGVIPLKKSQAAIDLADLLLLDIKALSPDLCKEITGKDNHNALETLRYCEDINKPVWIRHVLLPEYTLKTDLLESLAEFLRGFSCIQRIELLPYHNMGLYKWDELGVESKIRDIAPPSAEAVAAARALFPPIT
ncbi:MAG: pyruvate formate lyase-activating protein [Ruminococcus sp.]|nr:pyruvate formate lyase-activating protein [Ruminococcus sp.]MBQ8906027.1 pyruvate formate lyase-activating protein [Ruminococcus sp.]